MTPAKYAWSYDAERVHIKRVADGASAFIPRAETPEERAWGGPSDYDTVLNLLETARERGEEGEDAMCAEVFEDFYKENA